MILPLFLLTLPAYLAEILLDSIRTVESWLILDTTATLDSFV